ncbi:MAG: recombination protein RecR [Rickettsiales bacterium]|nr:recombination protein RecR [Rickettsiales bacterium]
MTNAIDNLSKIISKLPGLGPRIAKRIVLNLANNKEKTLIPLISALQNLNDKIQNCQNCNNLDEGEICQICQDEKRDQSIICVVEEVADLWAIERSGDFKGIYHILNGNLSAMSGKTIDDIDINGLFNRIKKSQENQGEIKEVVIATSATMDGQTTAHFLQESLTECGVKITRLAYGIPVGSELDYLDDGTISIAFKSRAEF